uniref:CASPASE_P20 domain-containing protein n=1 Tax=Globodera pallida TaxID=36090 RepID=A0A183C854_GLOPA
MSHRPRNDKSPENERRRRQKRAEQEENSESESGAGYSELESEASDDDALSPLNADEIAEQIQAGNFDNLKTILTKSMAEQTIRQWTVDDEEEVYTPNLNAVRGRALIINNHTFRRLGTRDGTNVDRERMYHLLKLMRYETTIKDNLRAKQMLKAVSKFSTKIAHNAGDSVVLVILTHGSSGRLLSYSVAAAMSQTPVSVTPATNNRLLAHEVIKEGTHRDELPPQRRNCAPSVENSAAMVVSC